MKNINRLFLFITMSIYGLSPLLVPVSAMADSNKDRAENHGAKVSVVAREKSDDDDENHGATVKKVAKDNYGHREDKKGNKNQALKISAVKAVPKETSVTISWTTDELTLGAVWFGAASSTLTSSVSETGSLSGSHQVTLTGLIPNTRYFYFIKAQNASSTEKQSKVFGFKTLATSTATSTTTDVVPPSILFATDFGLRASSTSIVWVTGETSDSKLWFGTTTPVSTSTTPVASSSSLSYFHRLNLPVLATSTQYFYTVSSTDAAGNTSYYSSSFTSTDI